jgi:ferredoxin--NADP+ reductase
VLGGDGAAVTGVYCAGWIKRGPTGVIGTNKKDATETVDLLLRDARAGLLHKGQGATGIDALLAERGVEAVTYAGWEEIDANERARGAEQGRPRVKLCTWRELLETAKTSSQVW